MNIGSWFESRSSSIPVFTWLWALGSVIASSYFAFYMFPRMVEPKATIYLQTQIATNTVYWPNSLTYRNQFLSLLSDKASLYYSACSMVAPSQNCDQTNNWRKLEPKYVGCTDVIGCTKESFYIPEDLQSLTLTQGQIRSVSGTPISVKDPNKMSLSDPVGWGDTGRWPISFIVLFFAVKFGRAVGEFLFTPYSK